jgi:hypothetical protein
MSPKTSIRSELEVPSLSTGIDVGNVLKGSHGPATAIFISRCFSLLLTIS